MGASLSALANSIIILILCNIQVMYQGEEKVNLRIACM